MDVLVDIDVYLFTRIWIRPNFVVPNCVFCLFLIIRTFWSWVNTLLGFHDAVKFDDVVYCTLIECLTEIVCGVDDFFFLIMLIGFFIIFPNFGMLTSFFGQNEKNNYVKWLTFSHFFLYAFIHRHKRMKRLWHQMRSSCDYTCKNDAQTFSFCSISQHVLNKFGNSWKRRFCVLIESRLFVFIYLDAIHWIASTRAIIRAEYGFRVFFGAISTNFDLKKRQ